MQAAPTPVGQIFLGFSRFPAARSVARLRPAAPSCASTTCASPAACSARISRSGRPDPFTAHDSDRRGRPHPQPDDRPLMARAASWRAHVGRRRAAARGRTGGRASLRGAADLREEREPVARARAASRRRSASFARGEAPRTFDPVVSHASYLINLASTSAALRAQSIEAMGDEFDRAEALGLMGVVLHPGCYTAGSEAEGLDADRRRARPSCCATRRRGKTMVLLEHTAGQGTALGATFEQLASIIAR